MNESRRPSHTHPGTTGDESTATAQACPRPSEGFDAARWNAPFTDRSRRWPIPRHSTHRPDSSAHRCRESERDHARRGGTSCRVQTIASPGAGHQLGGIDQASRIIPGVIHESDGNGTALHLRGMNSQGNILYPIIEPIARHRTHLIPQSRSPLCSIVWRAQAAQDSARGIPPAFLFSYA